MSEIERKRAGKRYNDEFKKTIVDLYHVGNSVKELSSEYGVSEVAIYKWVKAFTPISSEESSLTPKELAEIQKDNLIFPVFLYINTMSMKECT